MPGVAADRVDRLGERLERRRSEGQVVPRSYVDVEVLVLDDGSSDRTGEIVRQFAESDDRVRYLRGATLPAGWNGKQFACQPVAQPESHLSRTAALGR